MAEIVGTSIGGTGGKAITETTLVASDTLTFQKGKGQVLTITNGTAGALTGNIVGDGVTTTTVSGIGDLDISGGYDLAEIAPGAIYAIPLDSISGYLAGVIAVTGLDACTAILTSY